jgi:DNA polymerase-1
MSANHYLLVDGNNLLMRAVHATARSSMTTGDGVRTGPLHVFVSTLARHVREEQPTHLGIAWDCAGPSFRVELDHEYKGNRKPGPVQDLKETTFPLVKEFLSLAGAHHAEFGSLEADDVIAGWWRSITNGRITILSSDHDFYQLLGSNRHGIATQQVRFGHEVDRWNETRVRAEYGCDPAMLPYVMAIVGEPGDNIPGAHGIGSKTAVKRLLAASWSWSGVLADLEALGHDPARSRLNLRMVNLRDPWLPQVLRMPPPPPLRPVQLDQAAGHLLRDFCKRFELNQVLGRLQLGSLWTEPARAVVPGRPVRPPQSA